MFAVQFELNVKITGASLGEIDDGLMQAASERLKARILQKQSEIPAFISKNPMQAHPTADELRAASLKPLNQTVNIDPAVTTEEKIEKKKNAKAAKEKNEPTTTGEKTEHSTSGHSSPFAAESAATVSTATTRSEASASEKPTGISSTGSTGSSQSNTNGAVTPTLDDATAALAKVYEKFGMDRSRQILTDFKVKRAKELETAKFSEFIDVCNNIVETEKAAK